jgi:pyruvate dehydrogenase E2 component (dihydrolipoamide acetyltransferase)
MPVMQEKTFPLSRIQKLIGERMLESKRTQPCFYLTSQADVGQLSEIRRPLSKQLGVRISMNDFIIRAIAVAIEKFPLMTQGDINVGLAVASPVGLVVPVIKNANSKSLAQIAKESAELIEKARNNKFSLDDLQTGCITLTALGMFGINSFLPIPVPGQRSIISVGKIIDQPIPAKTGISVRKTIEFCLAADITKVDYEYAAKFLVEITNLVAQPQKLYE